MSRAAGADLPLRGNGCVAADFDLDGHTDLYVTTAGYNVPDRRLRRAALERRRRHVHGGRAGGRDQRTRLALPARRSGTSTATGVPTSSSPRYTDPNVARRSRRPDSRRTTSRSATCCTSTRARTTKGARRSVRSAKAAGIEREAGRARARRRVHRLRPRRTARPVRRERRRPESALPERPARGGEQLGLPLRGGGAAARASTTRTPGMGIAAADFSRDGASRPLRHELARAAPRRVPQPDASGGRPSFADARPDVAAASARTRPAGERPGPTSISTATSTSSWRTARSRS